MLVNGASPCNVYWQVGSSATLGTTTAFQGNLMALTSISLNNGATVIGRLLARNGQISLINNVLNASGCGAGSGGGSGDGGSGDGGSGNGSPGSRPTTRNGTATLRSGPNSGPNGGPNSGPNGRCTDGFTATVRGRMIARVVFRMDGRRIANRAHSPFKVLVKAAGAGRHIIKARVSFTDRTRARTLSVPLPRLRRAGSPAAPRSGPVDRLTQPARTAFAALLAIGFVCIPVAPAHAGASGVPMSQPLVVLLHDHIARTSPNLHARKLEAVDSLRPLTRVRTVLPVLERAAGKPWVRVRLPGRPNGHTGWIRTWQTRRASTEWHIRIDVSRRRVMVYRNGRVARRFSAVVGNPWTPTPTGHFFVEEPVAIDWSHGGPYALATSARSNVLQEFEGGPGQIGLHGTSGLSGALGTAASHGCIRVSTTAITWLAERIGNGVPLNIKR